MKNLMDEYIDFTSKKIKKYIKLILGIKYEETIVEEFLKTYINSRYYNINEEVSSRPFYLKITDELTKKEKILKKKSQRSKFILIEGTKQIFSYIYFFDNVRKVENFKTIKSIKEVIEQLVDYCNKNLSIKISDETKEVIYKEVASDILKKDIYLDNFETDNFYLNLKKDKKNDYIYYTKIEHNMKLPMQYSEEAIEKVFNSGTVTENKLVVEYVLLSVVAIRDILNGNFKDKYIAEFSNTLFKKAQKLESVLASINNQALQDKIYITVSFKDFQKNKKDIMEYTRKGYNFAIELDDFVENVEQVKELTIFKYVLLPQNIKLYKEIIKNKKMFTNILEK